MELSNPISDLRGVGDELAKKLSVLRIKNIEDLIRNVPRKYYDYSNIMQIKHIRPGTVTIEAKISQVQSRYVRRGMHITEALASDPSGGVRVVWFNQPYRAGSIKQEESYYLSGEFAFKNRRLSIINPSVELKSDFPINTARIIPIYRETSGLKSYQIRKLVRQVSEFIHNLPESLPSWLVEQKKLMSLADAIFQMHFPDSADQLQKAKQRLGFEEVFELSLASLINKHENQQFKAVRIKFNEAMAKKFVSELPYKLTVSQKKVVWQICLDMQKFIAMNRLVEGDVGSGKTVVAAMASVMVLSAGYQVAFMAPTELLATQHAKNLEYMLKPLGFSDKLTLLIGSQSTRQKLMAYKNISSGKAQFVIGTHALIQEKVDFKNLGLTIIDEQHRFGVDQRKLLLKKAGRLPHILSLSATPIPRSLALTLFGEMDISLIDEKPGGRKPIITQICSPNSRPQLYKKISYQLKAGRQLFVVCPAINDSEILKVNSAEKVYKNLSTGVFKSWRIGLLHGKMKSVEKEKVMQKFIDHDLDILVATTVIEVGVDIPNATVMLVENSERFGLAQLHQLRGRVGRSDYQGYCYLMMGDSSAPSMRIRALERLNDGFALADMDLEIRGPGALYGTVQHGILDLRVANISDFRLVSYARQSAKEFITSGENLLQYKHLAARVSSLRAVTNLN